MFGFIFGFRFGFGFVYSFKFGIGFRYGSIIRIIATFIFCNSCPLYSRIRIVGNCDSVIPMTSAHYK